MNQFENELTASDLQADLQKYCTDLQILYDEVEAEMQKPEYQEYERKRQAELLKAIPDNATTKGEQCRRLLCVQGHYPYVIKRGNK